ncbi:MAG: bifunctional enoyl-CoA hydratase/phosphate acetyltransferase [Caulobacteraceae bacterium]
MDTPDLMIENRTFDELKVGDSASLTRTPSAQDIQLIATVSGDVNPAHVDPAYAKSDIFHRVIVHGIWGGALISSVLGVRLPGPGTIYLDQSLKFTRPVDIGDAVTATVTVAEKRAEHHIVILDCVCVNQRGETVITGQAVVKAPTEKVRRPRAILADVRLSLHDRYRALLDAAAGGPPASTAVVHPCDAAAIAAVVEAAAVGLIAPILVGPEAKIRAAADAAGVDISAFRIVATPHSHAAAAQGVALVRAGEAQLLMKGSLHTDELMSAVVAEGALRTERRISHVYLMDVPGYPRPLLITDAAINIDPDLEAKRDIVQNAIALAQVIGIPTPKVAILAAVETINPKMRSTLEAAALCKMADRGQIMGGVLDGPLALDNAISPAAAAEKGIVSPVAGQADILLVPDLEAGNMLAKQLSFLGGADAAGIVLGAQVPIILTSRADSARTRIGSCALAVLVARAKTPAQPEAAVVAAA